MSIFLRLLILAASAGLALAAPSSQVVAVDWSTPGSVVLFEPNQGQADPRVHHLARTPAGVVYFTGEDLVLHRTGSNHLLRFEFLHTTSTGSTAGRTWRAAEAAAGTISYMVGRNPREWAQNVPRYRRLERKNLYDGIDLIYYGDRAGNLEYDLVLLPDVSPAAIRLRVHGARRLAIDADGALAIHPQQGPTVWHRRPYLYQTTPDGSRREVSGRFVLRSATDVGFEAGAHDPSLPLSIDPVIDGAAYLGVGVTTASSAGRSLAPSAPPLPSTFQARPAAAGAVTCLSKSVRRPGFSAAAVTMRRAPHRKASHPACRWEE